MDGDEQPPTCPLFPPEERRRLRAEIERLRAEQVSGATREKSRRRRAVTVGRKRMERCARDLRQAQLGWRALLLLLRARRGEEGDGGAQEEEEEEEEKLLALLDRIEALEATGRAAAAAAKRGRRRKKGGGPAGEGDQRQGGPPLPTPEETPGPGGGPAPGGEAAPEEEPPQESPAAGVPQDEGREEEEKTRREDGGGGGDDDDDDDDGGGGEDPDDDDDDEDDDGGGDDDDDDDDDDGGGEDPDDDNEDDEDDLNHMYYVDYMNDEDEVEELCQRVSDLQEDMRDLREDLEVFINSQMNEVCRLERTLHEALLHKAKRKVNSDLETAMWKFKEALWRFLLSDSLEDLPAKMAAWKKEVEALQEKIIRAIKKTPWRKQKRNGGREVERLTPPSRFKGFWTEAAGLHSAAEDLQGALMKVLEEEEEEEEVMVPLWKRLVALRRGPLEAVGALEEKRYHLESALITLFMKRGVPREEELLDIQEKATAIVDALNPLLLKEVGALPEKVGAFLGARGESNREILAQLPFPLGEEEDMVSWVNAVNPWKIIFSRHMKSPQKKVQALSQRLGDLNCVLRTSKQQEALQNSAPDSLVEESTILKEKLRALREVLQKKEVALKIAILNEVEDIAEQGQTGMSLPIHLIPPEPMPKSMAPVSIPQCGVFSSGIPSDPGLRRSWHEEVSQEDRHCLIQRFAKAISRSNNSKAPVKSQMKLEVLFATEVEEKIYKSAVNKGQYHDSLARKLLETEKLLEEKHTVNSPAHGVLGDPPTRASWPPAAPTADYPPRTAAAVVGPAELGRPPGHPILAAPRKSLPGADEATTRLKVKERQTSLPAGLDGTNRLRGQDVHNPEERSQAGCSKGALSNCSQNGIPVQGSEPSSKRQKTDG